MAEMILSVGAAGGQKYPLLNGTVEVTGNIVSETVRKKYILGGTGCLRRNVLRKFTVTADRIPGDPAQEFLLSAAVKFGVYSDAEISYTYSDTFTGYSESGTAVADVITEKCTGGEPDIFYAELYSCRAPEITEEV